YEEFRGQTLKNWLDQLAPASQSGTTDFQQGLRAGIENVLTLVDNTDLRGLQAIGLVLVIWAVVRLLGTVEASFNDIWGARRSRSFLRKLTDYLAIVFVAPILLVIGGAVSTALSQSGVA